MELMERGSFVAALENEFEKVAHGEGRCVLLTGEAGIGKTSLVKTFYIEKRKSCTIYVGSCDALFTPRPLAPLYDILLQMGAEVPKDISSIHDRAGLFMSFLRELERKKERSLIIIEDVHWADEATTDFIKFFARRVSLFPCLFIVTYRRTEIDGQHPLRNILGQLPPESFARLQLTPLSRETVEKMAIERGYNGEDVYTISGGNPFYVTEILASYSAGVPDNVKDSILSSYNRLDEKTKELWQILSVLPTGLEIKSLRKMDRSYDAIIHDGLNLEILVQRENSIFFKHELYRRTVEASLSPFLRLALNQTVLDLFQSDFEENGETERIIHHAKNANAHELVVHYSPIAARKAAAVGAHIEASRLYLSAIEYYQGNDSNLWIELYVGYAYECYLTRQIQEAIIYVRKALDLLEQKKDVEKTGDCLRFLSWLYWFEGSRKKSEFYGTRAVDVFVDQPPSKAKAMAYSNLGRLKMHWDKKDECLLWSERAMDMAKHLPDQEIVCHALISVGMILFRDPRSREKGLRLLQQSMDIALENDYEEKIGHAYAGIASSAVVVKDYALANQMLEEGIQFCEDRDVDIGVAYLQIYKARLLLETGYWDEAYNIAKSYLGENQFSIIKIGAHIIANTVNMRRGDAVDLVRMMEAKQKAFEAQELHRLPALIAILEYEWLTGEQVIEKGELDYAIAALERSGNIYENSAFAFWLRKARNQFVAVPNCYEGYQVNGPGAALRAAALWKELGCPYEQALVLFEGDVENKKEAISLMKKIGADAVYNKMKQEMRNVGITNIPRGIRKNTRSNPAHLTERELDILHLMKDGMQNKEIGNKLFIASKTVDNHITSIFFKLNVHSRTKAIEQAIQMQILKS